MVFVCHSAASLSAASLSAASLSAASLSTASLSAASMPAAQQDVENAEEIVEYNSLCSAGRSVFEKD